MAAPSGDSKASPFGAAKPVDTATKEKEVEEKRQQALRERKETEEKARAEKKEVDDKVRVDKKIADDKAREEKRLAKEVEDSQPKAPAQARQEKVNGQKPEKENGASAPAPGKNYEILRRAADEDVSAADEEADEAEEADQNGTVIKDKEIKPKEIVRDMGSKNGATINGAKTEASAGPSADVLENDGWSTVAKPTKTRKNGNQAARAIAS